MKELEKYLNNELKRLQKVLLLNDFYLNDVEYRKDLEGYLETAFLYPYKIIEIRYSDLVIRDWKEGKRKFKHELIHELCHSITDPLYSVAWDRWVTKDQINNERERVTDNIANLVINLLK